MLLLQLDEEIKGDNMKRTVIITGGSGGIGQGIALKFLQNNYNVVITSRKADQKDAIIKYYTDQNFQYIVWPGFRNIVNVKRIILFYFYCLVHLYTQDKTAMHTLTHMHTHSPISSVSVFQSSSQ